MLSSPSLAVLFHGYEEQAWEVCSGRERCLPNAWSIPRYDRRGFTSASLRGLSSPCRWAQRCRQAWWGRTALVCWKQKSYDAVPPTSTSLVLLVKQSASKATCLWGTATVCACQLGGYGGGWGGLASSLDELSNLCSDLRAAVKARLQAEMPISERKHHRWNLSPNECFNV